ncbi:MAG: CocE/NonD family hydrolase [Acidihalobacter sp.]|uniref:CocE/NonD family hydrolase n=1 Tax=Acidihalobacter sp. TaxID=1872108 RepID=UPI00307EB61D
MLASPETAVMHTRDGLALVADVYRPPGPGTHPVLLMRQPYGRRIASTVTYAHPAWYARQGFIVVVQDVRGRGGSEGLFEPFVNEAADGLDTLDWCAGLSGSNGRVGMYGFSYQGATQLFAAAGGHPALRAIAPAMTAWNLYDDWAYEQGALRLGNGLGWAAQLAAEGYRRRGETEDFKRALRLAEADGTALREPGATAAAGLPGSFFNDWLREPRDSGYWRWRSAALSRLHAVPPALFVGGWYDAFLGGTLAGYDALASNGGETALIVGPWGHLPWTARSGAVDFGAAAAGGVDCAQVAFFRRHLCGEDADAPTGVRLFDLGSGEWRHWSEWPRSDEILSLHPSGDGRVSVDPTSGRLTAEAAYEGSEWLVHDPWRPAPAVGGHLGLPAGRAERGFVDERPDVLAFTGAELETESLLCGAPELELHGAADCDPFTVCATLSTVEADGRTLHLTASGARLTGPGPWRIRLRPVLATLRRGQRLRLSVALAAFPGLALEHGDARSWAEVRAGDHPVITLCVDTGTGRSVLRLPFKRS